MRWRVCCGSCAITSQTSSSLAVGFHISTSITVAIRGLGVSRAPRRSTSSRYRLSPYVQGAPLDSILTAAGLRPARKEGPSAVWSAADQTGEEIEFLTPLLSARQHGQTVAVTGHGQIGTIGLPLLGLLGHHSTTLTIPVGEFDGRLQELSVRVPRLGAYVLNKAATVQARTAHVDGGNPKKAKDLVYLHDVMAAGDVVRQRVESDIRLMLQRTKKTSVEQHAIRTAISTLVTLLDQRRRHELVSLAAAELGTRDGLALVNAEAQIRGQLTDLLEMFREIVASRRRRPTG